MPKPPFAVDCNLYFTWESPPVFLQSAGKCGMVGVKGEMKMKSKAKVWILVVTVVVAVGGRYRCVGAL